MALGRLSTEACGSGPLSAPGRSARAAWVPRISLPLAECVRRHGPLVQQRLLHLPLHVRHRVQARRQPAGLQHHRRVVDGQAALRAGLPAQGRLRPAPGRRQPLLQVAARRVVRGHEQRARMVRPRRRHPHAQHASAAAAPRAQACNQRDGLQPRAPDAAAPRAPACNPACPGLQPRVPRPATNAMGTIGWRREAITDAAIKASPLASKVGGTGTWLCDPTHLALRPLA